MLHPVTLTLPDLPEPLAGLKLLIVTDPHVRRRRRVYESVLEAAGGAGCDLLLLLGDYMDRLGDEPAAHDFLNRLLAAAAPRYGAVGVFGNHDSPTLRRRLDHVGVTWLEDSAHALPTLPITVFGLRCSRRERRRPTADLLATLLDEPPYFDAHDRFRILLSHLPSPLPEVADTHIDLMLSGHTHGGQIRLPGGRALYNATHRWPLPFSAGILQLRDTRCVVSRGLGETALDGLRWNCPPQMPLITLAPTPIDQPAASNSCDHIRNLQPW